MKKLIYFIILILFCFNVQIYSQNDTAIVWLGSIDTSITTDVRYASENNFTGQVLYPTDKVFIRKIVGEQLSKINTYIKQNYNLRLKIFDGFRPISVQRKMWKIFPDDRYVANPKTGSRHNRGAAVDLTLVDSTGRELDMGTEYDNFTDKAHFDFQYLTKLQRSNRVLLRDAMTKFGFIPLATEWWHFDYKDWKKFSIIDFDLNH